MLSWFSTITGSYALGLFIYALLFKILFIPFAIGQQKNQIAMAKLTPKIELIKAKYKGRTDTATMQKQQQEILELQQKEGYSAFSGCLPMLLQIPLIFLLYNVIRNPISYICKASEEVVVAINSLVNGSENVAFSAIDQIALVPKIREYAATYGDAALIETGLNYSSLPDFTLFGVDLAATPTIVPFTILVLIPVIAAAFQWFTMWITRKINQSPATAVASGDAQTNSSMVIMDIIMPLMTLWIAFSFSGMLGLYWIYQSIISIVQTLLLAKFMPIPKYTEEELKMLRKAQKEQEKAQKAALKEQPKYKSLHYIDEDDYDELPEFKNSNQTSSKQLSQDLPEIKD